MTRDFRVEAMYEVRFRGGDGWEAGGVTYCDTLVGAARARQGLLAAGFRDVRIVTVRSVRIAVEEEEIEAALAVEAAGGVR